jgi:hypothetical protein
MKLDKEKKINIITKLCKYFTERSNDTFDNFCRINNLDMVTVKTVAMDLRRKGILFSSKYNNSSGYFESNKTINLDKLKEVYGIII